MSRKVMSEVSRRKFIIGASVGIATLAGCSGSSSTPTMEIKEISSNSAFTSDGTINPQIKVENNGDEAGTAILTFSIGNKEELVEKEIEADSATVATAEFDPSSFDQGAYTISVETESDSATKDVDIYDPPESGFYGRLKAPDDVSMSDQYIDIAGNTEGDSDRDHSSLSEDGFFSVSHLFEPPYHVRLAFGDQEIENFDGLPPVYSVHEGETTSQTEFIGTVELPKSYLTDVRLVDPDGNPITDLEYIGLREPKGNGIGPNKLDITSDGYVKVAEASETGIPVTKKSELTYDLELAIAGGEHEYETVGEIYGSESGEEFTFTIEDPSKFQ